MRKRSSRHRSHSLAGLRLAIDCMPPATRAAMLEGVRENERIIAGAYVDRHGGVCPMLAAHRRGGRTDFLSFARSWDRFTRAAGTAKVATRREIAILVSQLEDSLEQAHGKAGGMELDRRAALLREPLLSRHAAWLLVTLAYLYVFPYFERINNPNENVRIWAARAIVEHHVLNIDQESREWGYVNDKATTGKHLYSSKAPGKRASGASR